MNELASPSDPHLMLAFEGFSVPADVRTELAAHPVAGFSLFRTLNVVDPGQLAELTAELERANQSGLPLLIAADQETGQLQGVGGTAFPGNMAVGATGDPDLARRVGHAIGTELRAMGVTVDYAPVCDVVTVADNPSLGIRSFGGDPTAVATLAAATVQGIAGAGVIPVLKHFPGKGEARVDPHHGLPVLDLDLDRLRSVEFPPFVAGIGAGAPMIMVGHYGLPAITGRADLPSSLSEVVVDGLIRDRLGFDGVIITDALDMGALAQDDRQGHQVVAALGAGIDLLLCTPAIDVRHRIRSSIDAAFADGTLSPARLAPSRARIERLRRGIDGGARPPLEVVGGREHRELAQEVARRSVTLVRDDQAELPISVPPDARILTVMPKPADLTPADTSSLVAPALADAVRRHHESVTEVVVSRHPTRSEIDAVVRQASDHALIFVGTANATPEQGDLVSSLLSEHPRVVTLAMRDPFDLSRYPAAAIHLATYSIHPVSLDAAIDVVFGAARPLGRLPVAIEGMYEIGHGLG